VRVRMKVGEPTPMLLVDERALSADQRGEYVTIVNSDNVVEHRVVELGERQGPLRAIRSGLRADERVVINGLQRARPGVTVVPEPSTMAAV
jgi:membrane fusion protein, multidrug efflux system